MFRDERGKNKNQVTHLNNRLIPTAHINQWRERERERERERGRYTDKASRSVEEGILKYPAAGGLSAAF